MRHIYHIQFSVFHSSVQTYFNKSNWEIQLKIKNIFQNHQYTKNIQSMYIFVLLSVWSTDMHFVLHNMDSLRYSQFNQLFRRPFYVKNSVVISQSVREVVCTGSPSSVFLHGEEIPFRSLVLAHVHQNDIIRHQFIS